VNTCNTVVRVHSVPWCAKIQNRTHTHSTRFGNTAGIPIPVLNPSFDLASNVSPGLHSTHLLDPSTSTSSSCKVPLPPTTTPTLTSVPLQGEHLIHHLHKVLYKFDSTFGSKGIICTINALLNLPPFALTNFYHGKNVTSDGKCPFCVKSLR